MQSEWAEILKHAKLYDSHYDLNNVSVVILFRPYVLRFGSYIFLLQVMKRRHKTSPQLGYCFEISDPQAYFPAAQTSSSKLNTYYYYYYYYYSYYYYIHNTFVHIFRNVALFVNTD